MKVEIPVPTYELLKEVLTVLSNAETQHFALHDDEELIEPWTPSDSDEQISCPDLTVGLLRKAQRLMEQLKIILGIFSKFIFGNDRMYRQRQRNNRMKCYHLTNPIYVDQILKEGLVPKVGYSTELNHGVDATPCVFLSTTYEDRFDSTYKEDVLLEVDLPNDIEYQIDPKHKDGVWIMVFEVIAPKFIKIYT